jgi:hypothetical protein
MEQKGRGERTRHIELFPAQEHKRRLNRGVVRNPGEDWYLQSSDVFLTFNYSEY